MLSVDVPPQPLLRLSKRTQISRTTRRRDLQGSERGAQSCVSMLHERVAMPPHDLRVCFSVPNAPNVNEVNI